MLLFRIVGKKKQIYFENVLQAYDCFFTDIVCRFAQNSHYHDMATLIQLTLCGVNSSSFVNSDVKFEACGWSPKNGISTI